MTKPSNSHLETLSGKVRLLTFVNADNGYFIAKVVVERKGEVTVTGVAPRIQVGEDLEAKGAWISTAAWGRQFKADFVTVREPSDLVGIAAFIASAKVPGVGPETAKKVVHALGSDTISIIAHNPSRLKEVKGLGIKGAAGLVTYLADYRARRANGEDLASTADVIFLRALGITDAAASRIFAALGATTAVPLIKKNPYVICDVPGFGFRTADGYALKMGVAPDSTFRIKAAISHVLEQATSQGSCGLPYDEVVSEVGVLLDVGYALVLPCIQQELDSDNISRYESRGVDCLFSAALSAVESRIVRKLSATKRHAPVASAKSAEAMLAAAQAELGIQLDTMQLEAVKLALNQKLCVITGGPGTGKTTITRVLLHVLEQSGLRDIALAAPTGKAAKRASEATGRPARTIHRLLGFSGGGYAHDERNPLPADVLVLDEFSMVDVPLMGRICSALGEKTRLILVGDVDQLPSVGPGKVLSDILASKVVPSVKLNAIFRQAKTSAIITQAHAINKGVVPEEGGKDSDFRYLGFDVRFGATDAEKQLNRERMEEEILRQVLEAQKQGYDPVRDVQILSPMRKSLLGVEALNIRLQAMLNPHPAAWLEHFGDRWCTADKVMQLKNNYDKKVFNGDVGYITKIENKVVTVDFEGTLVSYKTAELNELSLAYAVTIHKSQGSEFPVVIMPVDNSHYMMLKRNLLYTGVTRAKKLCVLVSNKSALEKAVANTQNEGRHSMLYDWLVSGVPSLKSHHEYLEKRRA